MRKSFTFLLAVVCLFPSLSLLAQTNAFKLNGTNYITGQDPIFSSGNGSFTVEFWANVPFSSYDGNAHEIIADGDIADSASFYIGFDGSGNIDIGDTWGPTNVSMPFGVWTHFAVTFDYNSGNTVLYLNGVQQFTSGLIGYGPGANLAIGTSADLSVPLFGGEIQNVAVYNDARTAAQVKGDLFSINLGDPTLTMYYSMNTPDGTTIDNSASTGNSEIGVIVGDNGSNSYSVSPVQFSSNALTFDGVDDQVTFQANSAYDLSATNGGTIEFWVNPSSLSGNWATVLGNRGSGQVRYSIHLSSTQVGLDMGTGQVNAINLPDTFVTTGSWHHMAFVNTGSYTRVYINGVLFDSIPGSFGSGTGQLLTLGQSVSGPSNETAFAGSLDEVRIWNTQRSAADIMNNMGNTLTGTETGLVGEFGFDEGVPDGNNVGLSTTLDNSTTGNNGNIQFFSLSGTTSNYSLHTLNAVPLPLTLTSFTANREDNGSYLQWETAQEQNTLDFIVQRSPDGLNYSAIGTVDAAGNSETARNYSFADRAPLPNTNYYRLKLTDIDGSFTYSPVCVVNFPTSGGLIWYSTGPAAATVEYTPGNSEYYSLLDASGRLLRSGQLANGKTQFSGLPGGIYFVRIMTNSGPLVTKIIL